MNIYLIFTFILGLCRVLRVGILIRLWQYKRLYPNATIEEVKKFEKEIKNNYYLFPKNRNDEK